MSRPTRALLLAAAASLAACGGSDGGDTKWTQRARDICSLYLPCCVEAGLPTEEHLCVALFSRTPADEAASDRCLADMTEQAKSADFCKLTLPLPDSCNKAYPKQDPPQGRVAPGGACSTADDCAPSEQGTVLCRTPSQGGTGSICQVQAHAAMGEACAGTADGSATMLTGDDHASVLPVCYTSDAVHCKDGTCQPIGHAGDACTGDADCAAGTFCDGAVCAPKLPAGSSCPTHSACDDASYCAYPGVCKAKVPEGAPCEDWDECTTGYCGESGCEKPNANGIGLMFLCP